jgi:hypothetical protein
MSATTAMFTLAGIWIGIGLLLALVMGRHGHDPFAWWLLGTLLGPLAIPLALSPNGAKPSGRSSSVPECRVGVRSTCWSAWTAPPRLVPRSSRCWTCSAPSSAA